MDRQRKLSLRARRVHGSAERPRMAVFCSLRHIYVQIIDDALGTTLAQASTRKQGLKSNQQAAAALGEQIAARAQEKAIKQVVLDRRTRKYHGRIKALAEAARKGGLHL